MKVTPIDRTSIDTLPSGNQFATQLISWYQKHQRILPWRETKDPYKIWLSEIILQQTRVIQGLPYYYRFIERYPTVYELAAANETEVLRLWQGLGYYTRARNLHTCARIIVERFQGKFPSSYKILLALPGIGPYTAAAIASIAFKEAIPVVDGNVYRVLSRIFNIDTPINTPKGKHLFNKLAHSLISPHAPDLYNQAIMDFGATQCIPIKPLCISCTFNKDCLAFLSGRQSQLPIKIPSIKIKHRFFHYIVIQAGNGVFMSSRKVGDIWTGLYDFYLIEHNKLYEFDQLADNLLELIKKHQLYVEKVPKVYKHLLTHQCLHVVFFKVVATDRFITEAQSLLKHTETERFSLENTKMLPKPKLICNFLEENVYI